MANKQMKRLLIGNDAFDVRDDTARNMAASAADSVAGYDSRIGDLENDMESAGSSLSSLSTRMNTAEGKIKNITISASDPAGGSDGDIWIKYIDG